MMEEPPFPKVQLQLVAPVEPSVNVIVTGLHPEVADALIAAVCACT